MLRRRSLIALASVFLVALCALGAALGTSAPARAGTTQCPWLDTSKTPDQRAKMLLAQMTLDDKIQMVHGDGQIFTYYGVAGHVPANSRLCIPDLLLNDAGQGVGDGQLNTTAFPAPIAQAASWDPGLQRRFGDALGWEAHAKGINVMLAPDVNIARVPMNGRNFEAFGEDPYLSGQTGAAVIQGIQGEHVIATVKHYALNNQEADRNTVSSDVDERTLHEIYMPAFEAAVKQGRVGAVMCSYNQISSVYACEQPLTLTNILKKEFGFGGFVMSDWGATHSTVAAANAGLDMEMYQSTYFGQPLKDAVTAGQVPMSRLDDMVTRILRSMFADGVFDDPAAAEPNAYAADVERPDDVTLARTISEDGTVLLKNAGGALPLTGQGKKIAVIGPVAGPQGVENVYNGAGSSHIPEAGGKADVVAPVQGITQRGLANGDTVVYADGSSTADAVAAATASDVAVVFAGQEDSEGVDRANLQDTYTVCQLVACQTLPVDQDKLIASVAAANPNTVVVLDTGGPVLMPWLDQVKGVLEAWYPGQEDGNAIAAVLFGDVNPAAKLPETFPRAQGDLPTQTAQQYPGVNGHAVYAEGLDVGYRWYDAKGIAPLFPFGFGLSYTTFGYSGLGLKAAPSGNVSASFSLKNTGARAGAEVAQVYVGDPAAAGEPPKQLKAFQKVFLTPGQSQTVSVALDPRAFAVWDTSGHAWVVPGGRYTVMVGSSSRDIRLQGTVSVPKKVLGP
jgi:beta-glucosidase